MEKESKLGITVKKCDDFSEWYQQAIIKSDLVDYSAVSGCMVFKPVAYEIWDKIRNKCDKGFRKLGIKNAYFPMFIPEKLLQREATHFKGFTPEVAWVTHAGNTKLDERLAVRPTSETIMYDSYAKWIRSWRDLPLRLNQWNNVVRWEFKHPVPFLRTREFLWNEGHTVFETQEEAETEIQDIIRIYKEITEKYLALPGLVGRKSEKEKFAGAQYTVSIELFLPSGKSIQGPDAHYDGQNFSKAFNIKFLDRNEKKQFAYQNTWAITTRMIGVMVATHGDDKGIIVPPMIAPTQAVIIPILFQDSKDRVLAKATEIEKMLNIRVVVDKREEYSPGWKYNEWELKGLPVRIEIGPKDLELKQVVCVRRDTGERIPVKIKDLNDRVNRILEDIQNNLYDKAKKFLDESIIETTDWNAFVSTIAAKKLAKAPFCNEPECEDLIKDKTGGVGSRNIVVDKNLKPLPASGLKCIHCKKDASVWAYFAKAY